MLNGSCLQMKGNILICIRFLNRAPSPDGIAPETIPRSHNTLHTIVGVLINKYEAAEEGHAARRK